MICLIVWKKKSLLKDVIYDYDSKTSQDINETKYEEFAEDAYELSNDGKCPQFCIQCNELGQCIKCKNEYGIVEFEEDEIIRRNCKLKSELNKGYYKNNNIYYKCLDNCEECLNGSECINCKNDYFYQNNKCLKNIENCEIYDNEGNCKKCEIKFQVSKDKKSCEVYEGNCIEENIDGNCIKCEDGYRLSNNLCYKEIENCKIYEEDKCKICKEGFAFEEDNKFACYNISTFNEYYTEDEGISYFKCDDVNKEGIEKCSLCEYKNMPDNLINNNTQLLICSKCKNEYIIKDEEYNKCYDNETFKNDKRYYYEDEFHLKTCSKTINNCDKCIKYQTNVICEKCYENYFVNNNNSICIPINSNNYTKCSSFISNCLKCEYPMGCNQCESGYVILNNNLKNCHNILTISLLNYFTEDNIIYYSCEDYKYKNNIQCFGIITNQKIDLTFLQTQIKDLQLYLYMLTHSPLPKNFSLKLIANIYNTKRIRNLQNSDSEEKEIILNSVDKSNGNENTIVQFTENSKYSVGDDIQIKEILLNTDSDYNK